MRKHGRAGRLTDEPQTQTVRWAGLPERPRSRPSYKLEGGRYVWQIHREPLN